MENLFQIENLLATILLTLFHISNVEPMISSLKHTDPHKEVLVNRPAQYSQYLPPEQPEREDLPFIGDSPYLYGWKIKNIDVHSRVAEDDKNEAENKSPPLLPVAISSSLNMNTDMEEMNNVDHGRAIFREERLTPEDTHEEIADEEIPPKPDEYDDANRNPNGGSSPNDGGSPLNGEDSNDGMDNDNPVPITTDTSSSNGGNKHMSSEIGDTLSGHLCTTLIEEGYVPYEHDHSNVTHGLTASYLWVPIRQYVPGMARGVMLDPPVFASGCFKWKLKKCKGEEVWPLMKPCTYWAPTPLRTDMCGYHAGTKRYRYVQGRPKEMVPGHCMCDWPCIPYFDPFQRCRVEITENSTDTNDLIIKKKYKVSHNQALQLCRAIAQVQQADDPIRIPWLPIRIGNVYHTEQTQPPCFSWEYKECKQDDPEDSDCGTWKKVEGNNNCVQEEVAPTKNDTLASRVSVSHVSSDCPEGFPCLNQRQFSQHGPKGVEDKPRDSAEQLLIGTVGKSMKLTCHCDWPCLPFFDPINKCYDEFGKPMVDENGHNYLPSKNYLTMQDEGFVQCTRREGDITCGVIAYLDTVDSTTPANSTFNSQSSEH